MRQNTAGKLFLVAVLVLAGAAMGFYVRPLLYPEFESGAAAINTSTPMVAVKAATMVAACNLDSDQLDQLAGRMAPLVVQQLNQLGNKPVMNLVDTSHASREQEKAAQAAAFSSAIQMVDQMIANRRVSHEGMADAIKLLQQSGQADRVYELQGKIAVAMNKGELTAEEAGLMFQRAAPNQIH